MTDAEVIAALKGKQNDPAVIAILQVLRELRDEDQQALTQPAQMYRDFFAGTVSAFEQGIAAVERLTLGEGK